MLKKLFITILLVFTAPVFAGSFMNHEKFVHLSYEEQKQIVISMMNLMVEMEQQYHKKSKTTEFDQKQFERYTDMMRKFSNLLFPDAYAARNSTYGEYVVELRRLVSTRNGNKCLYGGWISEMGAGNKCTHPGFSYSRALYQTETGCNDGRNEITCNPAIFGFKNVARKTLFCVQAGEAGADNSSRDCMDRALNAPADANTSSKEERINNIIAGIAARPQDANAVFDFLLQACACDAGKVSPQMSAHYAGYMRPHQTCLGILKMMSEFGPGCAAASQPFDPNQLRYLAGIKDILTLDQIRDNANVTTSYRNALTSLRTQNTEFRNSEAAVCGTTPGPVTGGECPENRRRDNNLECCPAGKIANPQNKLLCIDEPPACPAERQNPDGTCCEANTTWNPDSRRCAPVTGGGVVVGGDTRCPEGQTGTPPACTPIVTPPTPTCPAGQTGTPPNCSSAAATCPDGQTGTPPNCSPAPATCPAGQTGTPPNCSPAPAACPAGQTGTPPNCSPAVVACTAENNRMPIPEAERAANGGRDCKCTNGDRIPDNGECPAVVACTAENNRMPIPEAERAANGGRDCKCSNGDRIPDNGECPATRSSSGMSISVTSVNKSDNTNATVTVVVTPSTYTTADYKIIWFRRGWPNETSTPARTRPGGVTPRSDEAVTGDRNPDTTGNTPPAETPEDAERRNSTPQTNERRVTDKDDRPSFDVERNPTTDYQMCARLIKKSDGSKAAEGCGKVQKRPQARGPSQGFMQQQPMMGPTRGGSSNATFQGVR